MQSLGGYSAAVAEAELKIRCSLQYFQDCLGGPKVPRSRFELDVPGCEKALAI